MEKELIDFKNELNLPKIGLLYNTPLNASCVAIRTCYDSFCKSDNMGEADRELINKVGNIYKHASVLEHLVYTFSIKGISRAALQKLTRHRMASFSVQSTQYTLKRLARLQQIDCEITKGTLLFISNYLYIMDTEEDILNQINTLNRIINNLKNSTVNEVKYDLPESFLTNLVLTINARSLQNLLKLRTGRSAMFPEIRILAYKLYYKLPKDHYYLFENSLENKEDFKELLGFELPFLDKRGNYVC